MSVLQWNANFQSKAEEVLILSLEGRLNEADQISSEIVEEILQLNPSPFVIKTFYRSDQSFLFQQSPLALVFRVNENLEGVESCFVSVEGNYYSNEHHVPSNFYYYMLTLGITPVFISKVYRFQLPGFNEPFNKEAIISLHLTKIIREASSLLGPAKSYEKALFSSMILWFKILTTEKATPLIIIFKMAQHDYHLRDRLALLILDRKLTLQENILYDKLLAKFRSI